MVRGASRAERRRQQRNATAPHTCTRRCWLPGDGCVIALVNERGPMTAREVAEVMGTTKATIEKIEKLARRKVRVRHPALADLLID